ncbi:Oidioi.mRNA.OKI2018_I69.chr1.g1907.t1.cds [Oikopleura dioica]|uniref:Membrane magnesium transporter n=1 Tax=Oikopleura dioica TaxID=34765 RepID=A0ABN7SPE4_OIKDI|nr:Oidioi.mRNA.OKI2018_I69.chr1.g1907.t1.cds [Oikopleura dioica]
MSKLLAFLGLVLMGHAAISVGQFRGIMKERGEADFNIPFDIILECLVGMVIASFGYIIGLNPYEDISSDSSLSAKPIEALLYRPGFYSRVSRRFGYFEDE